MSKTDDERGADYVVRAAPRLIRLTCEAAILAALCHGADRALVEAAGAPHDDREIVSGYCMACARALVIQLFALFDGNSKSSITFARVQKRFENEGTVGVLIDRACAASLLKEKEADRIQHAIGCFTRIHATINPDLRERLRQFRNTGVAHLDDIKERISSAELHALARLAIDLAACLEPFTSDDVAVPMRREDMGDYSRRALKMWRKLTASAMAPAA